VLGLAKVPFGANIKTKRFSLEPKKFRTQISKQYFKPGGKKLN